MNSTNLTQYIRFNSYTIISIPLGLRVWPSAWNIGIFSYLLTFSLDPIILICPTLTPQGPLSRGIRCFCWVQSQVTLHTPLKHSMTMTYCCEKYSWLDIHAHNMWADYWPSLSGLCPDTIHQSIWVPLWLERWPLCFLVIHVPVS